jgi:hypothetical protein
VVVSGLLLAAGAMPDHFGSRRVFRVTLTGFASYLVGAVLLVVLGGHAGLWGYVLAALIFSVAAPRWCRR